jgi:RNA polymerase sigma factor (sigma-70 family)
MIVETPTDGRLLADFASTGSPEAFEELVRRYGPLVTGVCRRVLRAPQDAEDVAQAVFLTLAHKAASLGDRPSVAGWLHHVARHLARNALKSASRQKRHEREAGQMNPEAAPREAGWEEVRPLLDQELDALPEKYRAPLILHYFQGRTQEDIARELGCQVGTISAWLHRGRELLRGRLARSGVAVSGALLGALILKNACTSGTLAFTLKAGAVVSPQVAALVQGGLKAMAIAKLKLAAVVLVTVGLAGTGAGVAAYQALRPAQEVAVEKKASPGCKVDLTPQSFPKLHALIRPQDHEWRHLRVQWITDVTAARRKAATEDKPMIILYTGGAGYNEPLGVC